MGLLDRLLGRNGGEGGAKRAHRARRSADERLKEERLRYLRWLKGVNPAAYQQVMARDLGGQGTEQKSELAEWIERFREFQQAGLLPKNPKSESGSNAKEWIEAAVVALGALQMQNQQPAVRQQQATIIPFPNQAPALPAATQPESEASMSIMSHIVITGLQGKTPDEAALWLLSMAQSFPTALPIVTQLVATPDAQLPALLTAASQQYRDLAPAMAWLNAPERQAWLFQTMAAIRRYAGNAEAGAT